VPAKDVKSPFFSSNGVAWPSSESDFSGIVLDGVLSDDVPPILVVGMLRSYYKKCFNSIGSSPAKVMTDSAQNIEKDAG